MRFGNTDRVAVRGVTRVTVPAPPDRWRLAYAADRDAVPYQSPAWTEALCADGRYVNVSRCYDTDDGGTLILPLVRAAGLPERLATAGSLPMSLGMGGLVGDRPVTVQDVEAVVADLTRLPYAMITIRPNPRCGRLWTAGAASHARRVARRAHIVDLEGGFDHVWNHLLSRSIRKSVEKATRSGLAVRWDSTDNLLPIFRRLYRRSVERWARRQHEPLRLSQWRMDRATRSPSLEAAAPAMAGVWRLGIVEMDGRAVVAGIVLIERGGNANGFRMAMDAERVGRSGAGYLFQVRALEQACQAGCRSFHLGESGFGGGLSEHKQRMGGIAFSYEELLLERLPFARLDRLARAAAKRLIGFRDADRP
jgi:hypothetical protein